MKKALSLVTAFLVIGCSPSSEGFTIEGSWNAYTSEDWNWLSEDLQHETWEFKTEHLEQLSQFEDGTTMEFTKVYRVVDDYLYIDDSRYRFDVINSDSVVIYALGEPIKFISRISD